MPVVDRAKFSRLLIAGAAWTVAVGLIMIGGAGAAGADTPAIPKPVSGVQPSDTESGIAHMVTITPEVSDLADGAVQSVYRLPDGSVHTVVTPPASFQPLTASAEQLAEYNFPPIPQDEAAAQDWRDAMSLFKSVGTPPGAVQIKVGGEPDFTQYGTNWAGYIAGTQHTQSHTYVAVKGVFTVPSITGLVCSDINELSAWIGLGGTNDRNDDLIQQGIECGDTDMGYGSAFRPFTEMIPSGAVPFCMQGTWTIPPGHKTYENMSFQTSSYTAYFYFEDETSGTAHSCSATQPYIFDGNTAEWIMEAPKNVSPNFGSVKFTDANAELSSTSSWVSLGSQMTTRTVQGPSSTYYCIAPGSIGSDHQSFTDTWHQNNCY